MASDLEYAALAAHVYNDQRGGGVDSQVNVISVPEDWTRAEQLGFNSGEYLNANPFSATAGAYVNEATGEIVIAYKGTDFLLESSRVWHTAADLAADVGLATNLGRLGILQQLHAALYYLAVKDWAVENGYDPSKISFTGHSLGGGLAANMAVWFEREAVTFAAGPFKTSATDPIAFAAAAAAIPAYAALFADSDAIAEEIATLTGAALYFTERASGVRNHYLRGEFLSYLRSDSSTVAGQGIPIDIGEQPFERKMDLHSMNLHLALKADARLQIDVDGQMVGLAPA